jgi:hypothetical protein
MEFRREAKAFNTRLNKTYKNKPGFQKCDAFCKKDYVVNVNRTLKKSAKRFKLPYKNPTATQNDFTYHGCKKMFCDVSCEGNKNSIIKRETKDGFSVNYSKKEIADMKKKGLLSGCVYDKEFI